MNAVTPVTAGAVEDLAPLIDALRDASALPWLAGADTWQPAERSATDLASLNQALSHLRDQVQELLAAHMQASESCADAAAQLEAELDDRIQASADVGERLETRGEQFADAGLGDCGDELDGAFDDFEDAISEQLSGACGELVADFDADCAAAHECAGQDVEQRAGALADEIQRRMDEMRERALAHFKESVESGARRTVEESVARMLEEIATNVALTQASVAVTGAVGPIQPQLVALRAAVSAIKAALKLMRGGF